jgi:hypothetical protein
MVLDSRYIETWKVPKVNREASDEISEAEQTRLLSLCGDKLKGKYNRCYEKLSLPGSNYKFDLKKLYIRLHCDFVPENIIGDDEDEVNALGKCHGQADHVKK